MATSRAWTRCLQQTFLPAIRYKNASATIRYPHLSQIRCFKTGSQNYASVLGTKSTRITCVTLSAAVTGYLSFTWVQKKAAVYASTGSRPVYKPSKKIYSPTDYTGLKLTLYQYTTCPFCCKVRAFLDFHGFSYDIIEVNSVRRTQIKWSQYKKVPILVIEGQGPEGYLQLNDSTVIISILESYLQDRHMTIETLKSYYPSLEAKNDRGKMVREYPNRYFIMYGENTPTASTKEMKLERKWRKWADDVLVHTLSPNVYRTPSEALQAFNYFSDAGDWENNFTKWERLCVIYVGATAMYFLGKILKHRYNLKDDVRESLYDACKDWLKGIGKGKVFMGGAEPNLSDMAVYGVLSSIEGCNAFQDLLVNTKIKSWYYATKSHIAEHKGANKLAAK